MTHTIYPCLWFDGKAREAAELYCSVFKPSKITADNPIVTMLELSGQKFMCLNGGSMFTPNASISFYVVCETKDEVQTAWDGFLDGGQVLMPLDTYPWSEWYGWVQDKYGVNWQLSFGKLSDVGQKFSPTLMFTGPLAGKAEEAIKTYTSIFRDSAVMGILRYGPGEGDVEGTVKHSQFKLNGYVLMAMDSSLPHPFSFNEGISLVVECDTQEDIDYYWAKLTEGGAESMCGWLKDPYGVSWQIIPAALKHMMQDPEKGQRVVKAFLQMKKFDIATLEKAYAGG